MIMKYTIRNIFRNNVFTLRSFFCNNPLVNRYSILSWLSNHMYFFVNGNATLSSVQTNYQYIGLRRQQIEPLSCDPISRDCPHASGHQGSCKFSSEIELCLCCGCLHCSWFCKNLSVDVLTQSERSSSDCWNGTVCGMYVEDETAPESSQM